jgi:CBS domain-containing protein
LPKLNEIMTQRVFTASPSSSIAEAADEMVKGRFGSAIIMEGSWISGIFTERDALRAAAAGADPSTTSIADWMTKDPVTVTADTDSEEAGELMVTHGFRHLPVVDGKEVIGIVSLRDILSVKVRRAPESS